MTTQHDERAGLVAGLMDQHRKDYGEAADVCESIFSRAAALLAAPQGEAVAWLVEAGPIGGTSARKLCLHINQAKEEAAAFSKVYAETRTVPLYTAPQPAAGVEGVKRGIAAELQPIESKLRNLHGVAIVDGERRITLDGLRVSMAEANPLGDPWSSWRDIPCGGKAVCSCCANSVARVFQWNTLQICNSCYEVARNPAWKAAQPEPQGERSELIVKALRRAFSLGQTYWQQADSDYISHHKKADETLSKFSAFIDETVAALLSAAPAGRIAELEEELAVSDKLLEHREQLLQAIPACPLHGHGCVPHALEWINEKKELVEKALGHPISAQLGRPPAAALQQLNKAYELGLEALRVCAGEQLSDRTTAKVERAITAMCNAMPVLDLIPADAVSAKALGELQSSYKDFMPDEAEGG